MRKKILGLVTLLLVLVCVAGTALAAHTSHTVCGVFCIAGADCNGTTHEAGNEHTTVAQWYALPSEGVTVSANGRQTLYVNGDTTLTGPIVVSGGGTLNLCLNGYTLTMGVDGDVITAGINSGVTICDCSSGKTGKIVHASGKVGRAVTMKGGDSNPAALNVYGGTFSNHTAPEGEYGAAFYLENTLARFFDCEISYNKASANEYVVTHPDCGTVYVTGYHRDSDLYLYKDAKITYNTSGSPGGVLVYETSVSGLDDADKIPRLYMLGGEISYNKGRDGGGVKLVDYAQLWLSTGSINNNSASTNGGGVFVGNQKTTKYPQLYMCGSGSITNNTAPSGGGVFNRGYFLANATGSISGNTATHGGSGGGLHTAYGDTDVWSLRITGNSAERKGGGVYIGDGHNGGSFAFATANDSPSERYIRGNTVKGVENNVHLEEDSMIWLYTASYDGGCDVGVTVDMPDDGSNTYRFLSTDRGYGSTALAEHLTGFVSDQGYTTSMDSGNYGIITGAQYTVTVTGGTGGGKYAPGATVTVSASPASGQSFVGWVTDDVTLSDPTAATATFTMPDKDVAIRADHAAVHAHLTCGEDSCSNSTHPDHTTRYYTGWNGVTNIDVTSGEAAYYLVGDVETVMAIRVASGAKLFLCLNGKTLSKSAAIDVQGTLHLCDCAGDGVITRPSNYYPRAAEITSSGEMHMYGGKLTGHQGTAKHGGALYNQGKLYIYGGEISGNKVTRNTTLEQGGYGGAIYSNSKLYIHGGKISGNSAYNGGGVCFFGDNDTDEIIMTAGEISGNTASSSEAGMWINGQEAMTATLTGGAFKNNTAGVSAGGIGVNGKLKLTISDMTFTGNATTGSGGGGGLYLTYLTNTATVEDCTITGNSAGMYGGGIQVSGSKVELKNLTITGNEADDGGGGIAVISSGNQVLIHNCKITGNNNTQIYGGGLYAGASGVTLSGNTTITGNTGAGQTANMQTSSGVTTGESVPKVTADFTGSVGVRTFYTPTATSGRPFIANAAGGAVTSAQLACFTSDAGYAKRVNTAGYGELFLGQKLTVVNGTGSGSYGAGEVVSISANAAAEGYVFDKWVITAGTAAIADVSSADTTVTIGSADVTVEATYKSGSHAITVVVSPTEGGTVTGAGTYAHGAAVTLTATPATGWVFESWQLNGEVVSTDATYTFTATESAAYQANFQRQQCYVALAVGHSNGGPGYEYGGNVTGGNRWYSYGETVTLTATLNPGWTFEGYYRENWELLTDALTYSFTAEEDVFIHAEYTRDHYLIEAAASPAEGGTVTGSGSYFYGETATLTATANDNWTFTNWTNADGVVVSGDATYTFTVTGVETLTANFTRNTCTVTTEVTPGGAGDVTGSGTYECGAQVTLTATAFEGWAFESWQLNGEVVSTSATYTFTADGDATLTAVFARSKHTITVTASPAEGGTVTGGGTYEYGEEVTLTATAAEGYTFTGWQLNGETLTVDTPYTFGVLEDAALTAVFTRRTCTITADATSGGDATGGGTYEYGATVTLTATASAGYTFTGWQKDGETVSTDAAYSFTATGDAAYTATFSRNAYTITVEAYPFPGGTVTGGGTYEHDESVTLTATAAEGYTFDCWLDSEFEFINDSAPYYTFAAIGDAKYYAYFIKNTYTITAAADPTEGGTVSGAGSYEHGATVNLTATASAGYTFTGWQKDGAAVSTDAAYSFTATGDAAYTATFSKNAYTITATASPAEGGAVSGAGSYEHGATVTLTATAAEGYSFTGWQKDGTTVSTDAGYSFTATGDAAYTATFSKNAYTITATADPAEGGTITGAGSYEHGSTVQLQAAPELGWTFTGWKQNGETVSTELNYTFTATASAVLTATFSEDAYTIEVTVDPAASGTVTGAGSYGYGDEVTLTATAAEGYTFASWNENGTPISTDTTYTFTATEDLSLVAVFLRNEYLISAVMTPEEGGVVDGLGNYEHGATVTLLATANPHYTFAGWMLDGATVSTDTTYSFTATGNVTLTAMFTKNAYTVSVTASPAEGGTVTGGGVFEYGSEVTVTATAAVGYSFTGWNQNGETMSTDASYTFFAMEHAALTATFAKNAYTITATADPTEGGSVTGAGSYEHGATVTLTATAAEGYTFTGWQKDGATVSTDAAYSFTATGNGAYTATFSKNAYTITATASPAEGGSVTGAGSYEHGALVTLTAAAGEGYSFTGWTKDGATVSTDAAYFFIATGNGAYTATFSKNAYTITATASPAEGGAVSGAGSYEHGATVTLTAAASEGYIFIGWRKDGESISANESYTFTATGNEAYTAVFDKKAYLITAIASPAEGGTITGAGSYEHGATVTLTATANDGWKFLGWKLYNLRSNEYDSTEPTFTFTAEAHAIAMACFGEKEPPVITEHPADQSAHAGEQVTFKAAATGDDLLCQWQVDTGDGVWRDIRDAVSTTLTVKVTDADNGHRYRCVFTNSDGEAITNAAKLTVLKDVPQTGDGAQPGLMAALMLLTMAAAWFLKRKTA